ncbi:hypothetical protein SK128_002125, partial [Halocaridina rubra]
MFPSDIIGDETNPEGIVILPYGVLGKGYVQKENLEDGKRFAFLMGIHVPDPVELVYQPCDTLLKRHIEFLIGIHVTNTVELVYKPFNTLVKRHIEFLIEIRVTSMVELVYQPYNTLVE